MDAFSLNISNCHVTKLETSNLEVDPSRQEKKLTIDTALEMLVQGK